MFLLNVCTLHSFTFVFEFVLVSASRCLVEPLGGADDGLSLRANNFGIAFYVLLNFGPPIASAPSQTCSQSIESQ